MEAVLDTELVGRFVTKFPCTAKHLACDEMGREAAHDGGKWRGTVDDEVLVTAVAVAFPIGVVLVGPNVDRALELSRYGLHGSLDDHLTGSVPNDRFDRV